jgi:hypothetical protein
MLNRTQILTNGSAFGADDDGFLDFDERVKGLKNASELKMWLDERVNI